MAATSKRLTKTRAHSYLDGSACNPPRLDGKVSRDI